MTTSRSETGKSPVLVEALRLHAMGLSILPIGGEKKPAVKGWKGFQTVAPDAATIESWFGVPGRGLGIILGPVSGDLVVRDFDVKEAYLAWKKEYPELAAILPKVQTKRGVHLYVRIRNCKTQNYGDGELRGAGSYVVAPPSEHPEGGAYEWKIPLVSLEDVPLLEVDETGFNRKWGKTDRGSLGSLGSLCTPAPLSTPVLVSSQAPLRRNYETIPERVKEAIHSALPGTGFKRHRAIFELARWFRGSAEFRDVDPRDLKPFVREWHRLALSEISTKAFEETWIDFLDGWKKVKSPISSGSLHTAMSRADELPLPEVAMQFDGLEIRRLVALCRELQKSAGDAPFFLACRVPEKWLEVQHTKINRWLNHLVGEGILSIVTPGTKTEATRYRYHGD